MVGIGIRCNKMIGSLQIGCEIRGTSMPSAANDGGRKSMKIGDDYILHNLHRTCGLVAFTGSMLGMTYSTGTHKQFLVSMAS